MKKYLEVGFGNTHFVRTEIELEDGSEIEKRGVVLPFKPESIYIRIWFRKTVFVLDSKEGFKKSKKNRSKLKVIFGVVGA